ncbi:hypothetical protein ACOQFO_05200 [Ureibacillus sp. MALMAid1270]|uniref:hypothetical protein n=1 Tax=Ureibacillus sp. MALMAid1270 TaxID=3411629 RepID=UPI003BA46F7C
MEDRRIKNYDLLFQTLGIIIIFMLIFISNKLSLPIIEELNSGAKITDIMFNTDDRVDISVNLLIPLVLFAVSIGLLTISIWVSVKYNTPSTNFMDMRQS